MLKKFLGKRRRRRREPRVVLRNRAVTRGGKWDDKGRAQLPEEEEEVLKSEIISVV